MLVLGFHFRGWCCLVVFFQFFVLFVCCWWCCWYGGKVFVLNLKYCGDGHLQPDRTVFWVQIHPSILTRIKVDPESLKSWFELIESCLAQGIPSFDWWLSLVERRLSWLWLTTCSSWYNSFLSQMTYFFHRGCGGGLLYLIIYLLPGGGGGGVALFGFLLITYLKINLCVCHKMVLIKWTHNFMGTVPLDFAQVLARYAQCSHPDPYRDAESSLLMLRQ